MQTSELILLREQLRLRGTGKTTLQQRGVANYNNPFGFVCENRERGKHATNNNPYAVYVTLRDGGSNALRGMNVPVAFDDSILFKIIDELIMLRLTPYGESPILENEVRDFNLDVDELETKLNSIKNGLL